MENPTASATFGVAKRLIAHAGNALVAIFLLTACLDSGSGSSNTSNAGDNPGESGCLPGGDCGSGDEDDDLRPSQIAMCTDEDGQPMPVRPKTVSVHNNSADTIYPVLTTSMNETNEWIQGCFRTNTQYPTRYVYKLYVNEGQGLAPGASVEIMLPLYSELTQGALEGAIRDYQYITWWNGARMVLADRKDRLLDKRDAVTNAGGKDIAFAVPDNVTCVGQGTACTLSTYYSENQLPENINAQLSEFTFGDSDIPAGDTLRRLKPENVGYNISYVDHVYLPIAIGPKNNRYIGYSGSTLPLGTFRQRLSNFLDTVGEGWPVYNLAGGLKLPGGYNVFAQRRDDLVVDDNVPVRLDGKNLAPLLTVRKCLEGQCSDAEKDALRFGAAVQRMQNLWGTCVDGWTFLDAQGNPVDKNAFVSNDAVGNCDVEIEPGLTLRQGLTAVRDFFAENHRKYLALHIPPVDPTAPVPVCANKPPVVPTFDFWQAIKHIYGWVPFNEGCSAGDNALADTQIPDWNHARIQAMYIASLQYNYQNTHVRNDASLLFNPYVQLIHEKDDGLDMNAYGFSVDDAVGFMSELGDGLVFTVGGPRGLENAAPFSYKNGFELKLGVDSGKIGPNKTLIKSYGICELNKHADDPDCMNFTQDVQHPEGRLIPMFRVGTVTYPIRVNFTDMNDNVYSVRVEEPFEPCAQYTEGVNCVPANASRLFDRSKINVETSEGSCIVRQWLGGDIHPKSSQWCHSVDPNQSKDKQLTKSYLSFTVPVDHLP